MNDFWQIQNDCAAQGQTAERKVKGNLKKWTASVLKDRNNDKTLLRNFVSSIHNSPLAVFDEGAYVAYLVRLEEDGG